MLSLMKKYKGEIDKCDLLIIELKQEIEKLKKEKDFSFSKLSELFKLPSVSETWIK